MTKVLAAFGLFVAAAVLFIGLSLLLAYPTMWLVNYLFTAQLLVSIFGIAKLTFWKAFWLNTFFSIAFKGTNTTSSSKK